jgi:hypothetical protein
MELILKYSFDISSNKKYILFINLYFFLFLSYYFSLIYNIFLTIFIFLYYIIYKLILEYFKISNITYFIY